MNKIGQKGDSALVKSTNEILLVKDHILTMTVKISLPNEYEKALKNLFDTYKSDVIFDENIQIDEINPDENISTSIKNGSNIYILSDNNKYAESELIIGVDNIRNYNLNKILK